MLITSQITFLYFKELEKASKFFEDIMQFKLVIDQGPAKIYRVSNKAFIGIVDEKVGYCKTSDDNAVLITLVANDVEAWYERVKQSDEVTSITDVEIRKQFGIKGFFFEGPGVIPLRCKNFLTLKLQTCFNFFYDTKVFYNPLDVGSIFRESPFPPKVKNILDFYSEITFKFAAS